MSKLIVGLTESEYESYCMRELKSRIKPFAEVYWKAYTASQKAITFMLYVSIDFPADEDDSCLVQVGGGSFPGAKLLMFYFNFENAMVYRNHDIAKVKEDYEADWHNSCRQFLNEQRLIHEC